MALPSKYCPLEVKYPFPYPVKAYVISRYGREYLALPLLLITLLCPSTQAEQRNGREPITLLGEICQRRRSASCATKHLVYYITMPFLLTQVRFFALFRKKLKRILHSLVVRIHPSDLVLEAIWTNLCVQSSIDIKDAAVNIGGLRAAEESNETCHVVRLGQPPQRDFHVQNTIAEIWVLEDFL